MAKSKMTLAAVNPRKMTPAGLIMKLMIVAVSPTIVAEPSFLVHQTVRASAQKPMISHRKGNPEIWKKRGEIVELRIPHRLAESDITAMS